MDLAPNRKMLLLALPHREARSDGCRLPGRPPAPAERQRPGDAAGPIWEGVEDAGATGGYVGFAVARTIWRDRLGARRKRAPSRARAAAQTAAASRRFIDIREGTAPKRGPGR